jgi:diaminopimelate decarboxylase
MPGRVEIAYAVKANPSLAVLAALAAEGLGADVASAGELLAVERAGFDPAHVVFTGPGKRDDELAAAVERDLRAITVESLGELERLRSIARRAGRRPRVMIRAAGVERAGDVIGTGSGRFGMRPQDLVEAARTAAAAPELELVGVHRFTASNVLDARELLGLAEETVAIARSLGLPLELIDLGGGLGIPYRDGETTLDLPLLGEGLAALLDGLDPATRLLIEPGRYLVGPAGTYLARVVDVKASASGPVATLDGGIHHLLRPALVGEPHRLRSLAIGGPERALRTVTVGGPLCTALDVLGVHELPDPEVGDLIAILDAGAYGFTESMPFFLSHAIPPEVVVVGGFTRLVRPRIGPEALLGAQALTVAAMDA